MIVSKLDNTFASRSDKPNENWTGLDCYFVVEDGSPLYKKILGAPKGKFELIVENDMLIDVKYLEVVYSREEMTLDFDYRLSMIELGLT